MTLVTQQKNTLCQNTDQHLNQTSESFQQEAGSSKSPEIQQKNPAEEEEESNNNKQHKPHFKTRRNREANNYSNPTSSKIAKNSQQKVHNHNIIK